MAHLTKTSLWPAELDTYDIEYVDWYHSMETDQEMELKSTNSLYHVHVFKVGSLVNKMTIGMITQFSQTYLLWCYTCK